VKGSCYRLDISRRRDAQYVVDFSGLPFL